MFVELLLNFPKNDEDYMQLFIQFIQFITKGNSVNFDPFSDASPIEKENLSHKFDTFLNIVHRIDDIRKDVKPHRVGRVDFKDTGVLTFSRNTAEHTPQESICILDKLTVKVTQYYLNLRKLKG